MSYSSLFTYSSKLFSYFRVALSTTNLGTMKMTGSISRLGYRGLGYLMEVDLVSYILRPFHNFGIMVGTFPRINQPHGEQSFC